jgi:hypothetical protein
MVVLSEMATKWHASESKYDHLMPFCCHHISNRLLWFDAGNAETSKQQLDACVDAQMDEAIMEWKGTVGDALNDEHARCVRRMNV